MAFLLKDLVNHVGNIIAFDTHTFYILKHVDLSQGNHKMMYESPNRGGKTYATLNRSPGGNDPATTVTDPSPYGASQLLPVAMGLHQSCRDQSACSLICSTYHLTTPADSR
jgi:hypothetical protein